MYALHESLLMLEEEGLAASFARHRKNHEQLVAGLESIGLSMAVDAEWRLPQLNSVLIPDGVDDAAVRGQLLQDFNLEIGAGLGELAGKQWRIGLMGYGNNPVNVNHCVTALGSVLKR